jgi:hypothetical protein
LVNRQLIDDLLKYKRLDGVDQALRSLVQNLVEGDKSAVDMTGELASFGGPAVAVWGREDQIAPAAKAADLGNAATVHIVDGVGHMAHMEEPQAVSPRSEKHSVREVSQAQMTAAPEGRKLLRLEVRAPAPRSNPTAVAENTNENGPPLAPFPVWQRMSE